MKHYWLFLLSLCVNTSIFSQNNSFFSKQVSAVHTVIQTQHYKPKPLNDSLSKAVFYLFIEQLDSDRNLFLKSDIDAFKTDELKLDDYIETGKVKFINKYITTLSKRVESSIKLFNALENETLDYSGKDTLYFKPQKKHQYFNKKEDLIRYLRKRVRYKIITGLIEEDSIFDSLKTNFKTLVKTEKTKVLSREICSLEEIKNQNGGIDQFVKEAFLNAYCQYHDPHSLFFNGSDKQAFERSVATNQETFGIETTKTKKGEVVISYITPGSPAFKNGKIETNDIVKSLTSNEVVLETLCVSNKDITDFMNHENHHTITFKIKKKNGTIHHIKLTRKSTKIEDNTINSFILSNKRDLGYINIPSFYTDLESPNGFGVANDIAKEIYKLQKENIGGLILDLRFNSGGSMSEAFKLSGMFINRGPLCILDFSDGTQQTIKDANRGVLFTKPILIIINTFSASASELFASVMQDYNRAIIVGSNSYGKASAQSIYALGEKQDLGFCKVTVEKFYRVTGKSNQALGVIPDIELPSLYEGYEINENHQKFALKNDSVKVSLKHIPIRKNNFNEIIKISKKHVDSSKSFSKIKKINTLFLDKYFYTDYEYPLTLNNIYTHITDYNNLLEGLESFDKSTSIKVKNIAATIERLNYNQDEKEMNALILKSLSEDIYIDASYEILNNYINTNTPN